MATEFNLIKAAQQYATETSNENTMIRENIQYLAKKGDMTAVGLAESITHVLAGLAQDPNMMNPSSIAALLAGVEKLAGGLASSEDSTRKQNTIRTLAAAAMKGDQLTQQSLPNHSVVVIAQFGAKFPELVQKYAKIATTPQMLQQAAKKLIPVIDRAMQSASKTATVAEDPASMGSAGQSAQKRSANVNRSAPITQGPTSSGGDGGADQG